MNLQAIFPAGVTELTVNGLHQWDYGRKLEIHADDLPVMLEVHFACPGMDKAIVRSCSAADGIAEAVIPDQCLEQSAPVVAWVFEVGDTSGMTTKTITMPVIARAQPQPGATIPTETSDRYTEAIAAMNEVVEDFKNGSVLVYRSQYADLANEANHAVEADTAEHAYTADRAYTADQADQATTADSAKTVNKYHHLVRLYIHRSSNSEMVDGSIVIQGISINDAPCDTTAQLRSTFGLYGQEIPCSGAFYKQSYEEPFTIVAVRFKNTDTLELRSIHYFNSSVSYLSIDEIEISRCTIATAAAIKI
jgi:hypothetical protein